MRLLRQPLFVAIGLCHLSVDALSGQVGVLLAVISLQTGFNNATIGLIATSFSILAALAQPGFGWFTDRFEERWTAVLGVLWMAAFFSLAYVTTGTLAILFLIAAALGTGAFHPPGAMKAAQIGEVQLAGRATTAASFFFLFGQSGWAIGPVAGGLILDNLGRPGLLLVTACVAAAGLFLATQKWPAAPRRFAAARASEGAKAAPAVFDISTFALVAFLAAMPTWASTAVVTFGPKYFQDQGVPATNYGIIIGLTLAGSALGGVLGAHLADRWSRRWTITLTLAASALPFYFFPTSHGLALLLIGPLCGILSGAPHSIFITLAQRAMPGRAAFASGMIMGIIFATGALGAYISGFAADRIGLLPVLQANALLVLIAAGVSFWLRPDQKVAARPVLAVAAAEE